MRRDDPKRARGPAAAILRTGMAVLLLALAQPSAAVAQTVQRIAAVVNVADDTEFHGLLVCPDLDTITYTLAGAVNPDTGWGLAGETWAALGSLRRHAKANGRADIGWFALGDLDLGPGGLRQFLDQGFQLLDGLFVRGHGNLLVGAGAMGTSPVRRLLVSPAFSQGLWPGMYKC